MWIRLVLLLALMTPLSAPSQAAELCNSTSYVIRLATGWTIDGGVAIQGWQRLRPGECAETPADIDLDSWDLPPVFKWMAETGGIAEAEMLKTFNCGVGMILSVSAEQADALTEVLVGEGETVTRLGAVTAGAGMRYSGKLL